MRYLLPGSEEWEQCHQRLRNDLQISSADSIAALATIERLCAIIRDSDDFDIARRIAKEDGRIFDFPAALSAAMEDKL